MARRAYKDFTKGVSPRGKFVYPKLTHPDFKFAKEHGLYSVSLDLEGDDAEELIEIVDTAHATEYIEECKAKRKKKLKKYPDLPYGEALDADKDVIEGVTRFSFKRKAGGRYPDNHEDPTKAGETWRAFFLIVGARGKAKVTEEIWGGTVGRVAYVIKPWFTDAFGFGVRLEIVGIKVLDLVTKGERTPEDLGFEDEEGYDAAGAPPVDTHTPDADREPGDDVDEDSEVGSEEGGIEF